MKKILFIRTRIRESNYLSLTPPLGLMYLASAVRERFPSQYTIKIIDMGLDSLSAGCIKEEIQRFKPDIIGCSVLSCEDDCMNELANVSKLIDGNIKFIVGGPHATMHCVDVLENHNIDIAVLGEGEEAICELLQGFENNGQINEVTGIAFRKDGQVVITAQRHFIDNLDSIPFPAWDLIRLSDYSHFTRLPMGLQRGGKRYMTIFTSRGCPYQCIYCHNIFGKVFRKRSAENVFKEMAILYDKYGVDEFHIVDDIFNLDKKRVEDICDYIISSGMNIYISFPNGLRGDILDEGLLEKLKSAGTYLISFALETASPGRQKIIGKNIDIEKLKVAIEAADNLKMLTRCFFMLGFPGETIDEVKQTIDFALRSKLCMANFFVVTPQKNTQLFRIIEKDLPGFPLEFNKYTYYHSPKFYEKRIARMPLTRLMIYAYLMFYLNPQRVMRLWSRTRRKIILLIGLYFSARVIFSQVMSQKVDTLKSK
jgi:radical SAM superfamily enzyme YgiQ (UPF0313 family)